MAGTDYAEHFESAIARLKSENRYRTFANLERDAARFPVALWRPENAAEAPREVTIWCSNDYLGMGQHPKVIMAMKDALKPPLRSLIQHSVPCIDLESILPTMFQPRIIPLLWLDLLLD